MPETDHTQEGRMRVSSLADFDLNTSDFYTQLSSVQHEVEMLPLGRTRSVLTRHLGVMYVMLEAMQLSMARAAFVLSTADETLEVWQDIVNGEADSPASVHLLSQLFGPLQQQVQCAGSETERMLRTLLSEPIEE
jgi:hypothetical protein